MTKWASVQHCISILESFAPKRYAYEGDPIGLQVGTLQKKTTKVMIALDVLEEVVDEAIEKKADLIIAHHPLMYIPLKRIDTSTAKGRTIQKLLQHDITVYAAHTNLDVAEGGVNDWLADALKLQNRAVLQSSYEEELLKLAVFVPASHAERVREALGNAGAGHIGQYSHCSFTTNGTGNFMPLEGSSPFIGKQGIMESVEEVKIETILPASILNKAVSAMLNAHPYEEAAYDIYPVNNPGQKLGIGQIGTLPSPMNLEELAAHVKNAFSLKAVRAVKGHDRPIQKIAVVGGDGNKFIKGAISKGADALITGDIYYHNAHDAMEEGLTVIDAGHNIEKIMKHGLQRVIDEGLKKDHYSTEVIVSEIHTDPFTFV
ncbi:Nif3-like dinuclear metal center hexameric protein [Fictibacillus aquaticus]|uniref:GTP cyclohydrolase 1 type 2 homolog n=1 Tax=Fictibacillus aquaticus TaxID=2021314 RepID=A0A235F9U6_9BACL|nr:Nif3-like dinuclear metal center hexameric protein [Fictibacillus aquaticus]OYD57939.1 Nif3-like dinuclear metal center hexameric protein [Fictibacillus aquaticus]